MAKNPGVEEAVELAERFLAARTAAIRELAEARQHTVAVREAGERELAELRAAIGERIAEAERGDVKAHSAALSAGWSVEDLRKMGFAEPDKTRRVQRRRPKSGDAGRESELETKRSAATANQAAVAEKDVA